MDDATFRRLLKPWMAQYAQKLIGVIPSGSGVFRAIDIPGEQYQIGYVSTSEGSFKKLGISGNWYGTEIITCIAEVRQVGNPIFEAVQFQQDIPILNAFNLPEEIREAIYDDRDLPSGRYSKSHIVLEIAQDYLPETSYSGVYFPSRRENGGVLVYDPTRIPAQVIRTDTFPPPAGIPM